MYFEKGEYPTWKEVGEAIGPTLGLIGAATSATATASALGLAAPVAVPLVAMAAIAGWKSGEKNKWAGVTSFIGSLPNIPS